MDSFCINLLPFDAFVRSDNARRVAEISDNKFEPLDAMKLATALCTLSHLATLNLRRVNELGKPLRSRENLKFFETSASFICCQKYKKKAAG